jgi:hypothetical protein
VGAPSRIIAKGKSRSTRAGRRSASSNLLAEAASMDAIFWVLAALIIYFLFFRPAG